MMDDRELPKRAATSARCALAGISNMRAPIQKSGKPTTGFCRSQKNRSFYASFAASLGRSILGGRGVVCHHQSHAGENRADLAGLTAHGRRMDRSPHVDRSRSHLNHHWSPPALELNDPSDLVEAVDAVIAKAGAKTHRGSAVAADFHLGASPGFFEQEDGSWDYDRIGSWYKANRRAMMERFPGMIASVRLDLDESSPHIAVCLVPLAAKTTKHGSGTVVSFRKLLGGASKAEASSRMIELQDWYAEQMRPLGLRRGIPKIVTGRVGLSHQHTVASGRSKMLDALGPRPEPRQPHAMPN